MRSPRRKLIDTEMLKIVPNLLGISVLEVGAGENTEIKKMFPRAKRYVTLDLDTQLKPTVTAVLEHSPFMDKSFDTIICLEVLEHVIDPYKVLSELNRLLTIDGSLILSVPFLTPKHMGEDNWRFTKEGLVKIIGKYLLMKEIRTLGNEEAALFQILHMQYRKIALWPAYVVLWPIIHLLAFCRRKGVSSSTGYLVIAHKK